MRILILNYEFPPIGGGGANASQQLARHLTRMGNEVSILTSCYKDLKGREEIEGYSIYRILTLRRFIDRSSPLEMTIFGLSGIFNINRLIKLKRPDIIIAFFGIPSGPVALWAKMRFGIPYIISLQGGDVPGFCPEELRFYHLFLKPVIRYIWKGASAIVANSNGLKEMAKDTFSNGEIFVIPNGVDTEFFSPYKRSNTQRILSCGRMRRQKGFSYLIKALANLPKEVTLELVGDGPLRRELELLTRRLNLEGRVIFTGWLSKKELVKRYQEADIFVLSSIDEGMPNVLLEAMACGLPVVATDVPGSQELIEPGVNGFLVPVRDSNRLAWAIERILNDKYLKKEMGEKSRIMASRYSWKRVAMEYLEVCERILKYVSVS